MQSSNPYTFRPVKKRKSGGFATFTLATASVVGGVVFGIMPNGGLKALFPSACGSTTGGTISGISTGTTTPTTAPSPTKTGTGDAVNYAYGTVQLKVTQTAGKITAVDLVQATATAGREQAFSYLQQYAIKSNGSSFGNLGGATFTTQAFKQALDSAISKLG